MTGISVAVEGDKAIFVDDVWFSNALKVEHNVLEPGGVIGHIARHRTINPSTRMNPKTAGVRPI